MFKARFTLIFVLIAAFMVVAQPRCTWACSCIAPGTPEEELDRSVAVFSGRVENIQAPAGGAGQVRVTLAVSDVWKGDVPATTVVETTSDSASCGFNFEEGQEYLVYANAGEGGLLSVSLCSRTQSLANAQDDLAALGEGQAPGAEESPEPESPAPSPTATDDTESPSPVASPAASPEASPTVLPDTAASSINLAALVVIGGMGMLAIAFAGYMLRKRMS